jgi:hypothetical protein
LWVCKHHGQSWPTILLQRLIKLWVCKQHGQSWPTILLQRLIKLWVCKQHSQSCPTIILQTYKTVVATFEKHIFLSQTDLTRTGIISNSYNEMFEA